MPAGLLHVGEFCYSNDRHDGQTATTLVANATEAHAVALGLRTFACAVRDANARGRAWVTDNDLVIADSADDLIEFFLTCGGFEMS